MQDCGHNLADDSALFEGGSTTTKASAVESLPSGCSECTVLAWDERMALHAEGRAAPHPERPDRLRAIMARLLTSGIAGVPVLVP